MSDTTVDGIASPDRRLVRRAVIAFCVAFVALGVLIPLRLLPNPANRPFGWQMYSAVSGHHYEIRFSDGSTETADPGHYVLRYRSEVDYRRYLPDLICEKMPRAAEVVASNPLAGTAESYPCKR